jgi:hypothetical protein
MATIQQERQPFWQQTWFVESNWISISTKWLLTFGGKAARLTLIICTLYMSAELYPGVKLPPGLNLAVFILLSAALDMGGLGLSQIAKTARAQGNIDGAERGERLSKWLIGIMIAGMVTISLENAANMVKIAADIKNYVQIFWTLVEIVLSIARMVCAVNYGHVVHALEHGVERNQVQVQAEREARQAEIERIQRDLQEAQRTASETQSRLQRDLREAREGQETAIAQLSCLQESLNQSLQNGTSMQASMTEMELAMQAKLQATMQAARVQMQAEMKAQQEKLQAEAQATQVQLQAEIADLKRANVQLKAQQKEQVKVPTKPELHAVPSKFDAREFVFSCLRREANLKLAEIAKLASMQGQELSETTISRYRKEYRESSPGVENESSAM